jgi:hypothetical protein
VPAAASPKPAAPLTAEELALIEADPAKLTYEQRKARSYALRKKIMQNPDSPAAKAIIEAQRALAAGELQVPEHMIRNSSPAADPGLTLHQKPEVLEAGKRGDSAADG